MLVVKVNKNLHWTHLSLENLLCREWNNTRREERKCNLCNTNDLGDEFHYMFSCDQIDIKTMRKKCLPVYYYRNPNTVKFERLFNCTDQNTLNMLCKFIHVIKEKVQPPG